MVKQSKIIAQQPKTIKNPNIVNIKSAIIEHRKTSKIGSADNPLYSETKK